MIWQHEPAQWQQDDKGIADNAPFYAREVTGDFTAIVRVAGAYNALYDQAGLMVRENERVWMKCGIEFLDGVQQASAILTRDYSDWSVLPLPDNPAATWFRVQRFGTAVEVSYSRDGVTYQLIRQGYLSSAETLWVGLMCAAPKGEGFSVTFEDFAITPA